MSSAVVCHELSFAWPDGSPVLAGLDVAFDPGRTGLVGRNGSGKSTLLALVAGRLTPTAGTVHTAGRVGYLPQTLTLDGLGTVSDLLGIGPRRAALAAIERGETDPELFDTLGDGWDIEERALGLLDRFGLPGELDRPVTALSGGEVLLAALAGLLVDPPEITLLDEPTNNLDARARERLYAAVASWPGVLVVVSHDRELLERVDRIVELREGAVRTFGGPFSAYLEALSGERDAAERMVRAAKAEVRRERRQLVEAQVAQARRQRYGAREAARGSQPRILLNQRKRDAQVSAGKSRAVHDARLAEAKESLGAARAGVREDDRIRIDLPDTELPAGRTVLEVGGLEAGGLEVGGLEVGGLEGGGLTVRGPERIALVGPNGAGKTTLLRAIVGERPDPRYPVRRGPVPVGYLPQRLDLLDDTASVLDNLRQRAPSASPERIRSGLARFLVTGDEVHRPVGTLSGGERFRVTLACLLLAEPAPRLLLLDEPTNNLDLDSVEALTAALAGYRGALIVVSHDQRFLAEIGVERWWVMAGGRLSDSQ